jgi:fructokinase
MKQPILGLGEILWDLLPDGPQLGGAPFNFTFHCHQLGWPAVMVSRIGRDSPGQEIQQRLRDLNLSAEQLQVDPPHSTGTVTVAFDTAGQPSYTIHENVAWDYLAWQPDLATLAQTAAAVCFGTLAQRNPTSRATIRQVIEAARSAKVVCDINLRQHYWDREVIVDSLRHTDWLKLNSDELATLASLLNLGSTDEATALRAMRERYDLELVCLTRGADGCRVETATETIEEPGIPVKVIDTIGAGDSFTAGLLVSVLEGRPLREAVARANRLAARVAGSKGGTPVIDVAKLGDPGA